jgi:hypothetical protein
VSRKKISFQIWNTESNSFKNKFQQMAMRELGELPTNAVFFIIVLTCLAYSSFQHERQGEPRRGFNLKQALARREYFWDDA